MTGHREPRAWAHVLVCVLALGEGGPSLVSWRGALCCVWTRRWPPWAESGEGSGLLPLSVPGRRPAQEQGALWAGISR